MRPPLHYLPLYRTVFLDIPHTLNYMPVAMPVMQSAKTGE
ncbi:CRISPR-associated DxTHG motif protein [Pseudomonas protegens]|nr:CRISPR-associated DxTHG motif protein [Pseudomonas protegens]